MAVSTAYRRLFLRALQRDILASGLSLQEGLLALADARYADTKGGRIISSTSANGQSVSFAPPIYGNIAPMQAAELVSWMLDLYDIVKAEFVAAGTASPTDDQMVTGMLAHRLMGAVRSLRNDFSTYGSEYATL